MAATKRRRRRSRTIDWNEVEALCRAELAERSVPWHPSIKGRFKHYMAIVKAREEVVARLEALRRSALEAQATLQRVRKLSDDDAPDALVPDLAAVMKTLADGSPELLDRRWQSPWRKPRAYSPRAHVVSFCRETFGRVLDDARGMACMSIMLGNGRDDEGASSARNVIRREQDRIGHHAPAWKRARL